MQEIIQLGKDPRILRVFDGFLYILIYLHKIDFIEEGNYGSKSL